MASSQTRFLRVTKDNAKRDRGLIAIDGICSIFENQVANNVSIMTMDGFWVDVVDDLDSLYNKICKNPESQELSPKESKKEYFRKRKMMSPSVADERVQQNHGAVVADKCGEDENDVFQPISKKRKVGKIIHSDISKSLPSSEGEGHYNLNPKPPGGEIGDGL